MNYWKDRWGVKAGATGWLLIDRPQRELTCCSASSSSLLIFRSSSNILHRDKKGKACYCSRDLPSARIRLNVAHCDLPFPLKNLSGKDINYTAKAAPAHGREWGSGQWMEYFATKNLPDVRLWELGEESQIVFSPGNFLSDKCWPTAKNSLETKRTCSAWDRSLSQDCTWKFWGASN